LSSFQDNVERVRGKLNVCGRRSFPTGWLSRHAVRIENARGLEMRVGDGERHVGAHDHPRRVAEIDHLFAGTVGNHGRLGLPAHGALGRA